MTTVSNLEVLIGADISALRAGMEEALGLVDGFGGRVESAVSRFGGDVTRLGAGLQSMTDPIKQFGLSGIDTAANFQDAMAEISARTGIVGDELQTISDFALQMGADTAFSGQQAAEAFLQLLSSGQTAEEAIATLPIILDAAAASGEDLGRSADVVTDIMAAFGLGVEDARGVVDVLAAAAGASSADMSQLGQGFANVGGIARNFGLSVEDTAAVLAIFSENGTKGAEAGTLLKSMLLNMSRNTDEVTGAWGELGVSMYDAAGNMRPLNDIITDLDGALDTLTPEEQNYYMQTLAGSFGIAGLTALRGSISIDKMKESMDGQAAAADVARARMDTFNGRMDSLRGSVETLMINALTPLMDDVLSPLASLLTDVTNEVNEWAIANPDLTNTIIMIGGALTIAGPALIALGTAITLAAPAVGLLAGAFALLVSPLGLVIAGIAGLQALGIINIPAIFDSIRNAVENVDLSGISTDALRGKVESVFAQITFPELPINVEEISSQIETTINGLDLSGISTDALRDKIVELLGQITFPSVSIDLSGLVTEIEASFSALDFSNIETIIDTHFEAILGAIITVAGLVFGGPVGLAIGAARLVSSAIENDFMGIGTFLEGSGISGAVEDALNGIKDVVDGIISTIFGGGGEGGETTSNAAEGGPLALFVSDLKLGLETAQGIIEGVWNNIKPGIDDLVSGIQGFVGAFEGTETSGLLRVVTVVAGAIGLLVGKALEIGSDVFGTLLSSIGDALPKIGSAISDFISAISNVGEGDFADAAKFIADGVLNIVEAVFQLNGLNVELPEWEDVLEAWRGVFRDLGTIIEVAVADIQAKFGAFVRDLRLTIQDLQVLAAEAQINLGINVEGNKAFLEQMAPERAGAEIAKQLEDAVAGYLAGNPVNLDIGGMNWAITGEPDPTTGDVAPDAMAQSIVDNVVNPTAIQAALDMAIASGDTAALTALLPVALELAEDPATQMQELLTTALDVGGENSPVFAVLAATATELDIDVADVTAQYDAALKEAAAAQTFNIEVIANVRVRTADIDMSGVQQAVTMGPAAPPANTSPLVPKLAVGGYIEGSGLAYVHAGEVVLNKQQQEAWNGGSGGNTFVINAYGSSPQELAAMVEKAIRSRAR